MPLQVYSTLTRSKVPFAKKPGEAVTLYVCGPTVYKPSHIGHMVGPVIFDTVKRYLTHLGYRVTWVVNITDVDDKLIKRAAELKTTVPDLARKMTDDYYDCLKKLNVTTIDHFPKATEHIGGMVAMIDALIVRGFAYVAGTDVYFDVSKDHDYGKLCNRDPEAMEAGARLEINALKRNPGDFALWKGAKPTEPIEVQFDSPWGKGRPGWHIECSAMSKALLGETIDIHGGGLDLQFPHHENELAQSESASGKDFARIWMHNGLLRMGKSGKMAGSVGNVWNIADALKNVSGDVLRFFILSTHYRSPIDMGEWKGPEAEPVPPNVVAAKAGYDTFLRFAERVQRITGENFFEIRTAIPFDPDQYKDTGIALIGTFVSEFENFMNDDFNTGGAVGVLFQIVSAANKYADDKRLDDPATNDPDNRQVILGSALILKGLGQILGLFLHSPQQNSLGNDDALTAGLMQLLIDLRNNLRAEAKGIEDKTNPVKKALFAQTDLIRQRLAALNVTLEDRPAGTTWRVG